jgi:hypothetical protein
MPKSLAFVVALLALILTATWRVRSVRRGQAKLRRIRGRHHQAGPSQPGRQVDQNAKRE